MEGERNEAMDFIAGMIWFLGTTEPGLAADGAIAGLSSRLILRGWMLIARYS